MPNRQYRLQRASNQLAKFFGLSTVEDLVSEIALSEIQGIQSNDQASTIPPNQIVKRVIDLFVNTSDGALTTAEIIRRINFEVDSIQDPNQRNNALDQLSKLFEVFYSRTVQLQDAEKPAVVQMLGYSEGQDRSTVINSNANEPSKEKPGLSAIVSNSTRISLSQKNINPIVLFLNGVPNVELSRAIPYVNLEFFFAKPPKAPNGQLQTLSLTKFLYGAQQVNSGSMNSLIEANKTAGENIADSPQSEIYSIAGMEMFTTPQTLVNADEVDNPSLRSNPVLDKFRPPLSLKDLEITVQPSTGMMSFKTAKLGLILHDRSRLSEVAEFIRADLYGTNEILIEYGWTHPDGESLSNDRNPYGDLINGLRVKEKYGVVNSSFTFDEAGQVSINLELAMRGGTEFNTELISSDANTFGNVIREIEELQKVVGELRERAFAGSSFANSKEVRGVQILDAAQDALNHTTFNSGLREALYDFKKQLRHSQSPSSKELIQKLEKLYGRVWKARDENRFVATDQSATGEASLITQLKRSVQDSVRRKVRILASDPDPFLESSINDRVRDGSGGRLIEPARGEEQRARLRAFQQRNNIKGIPSGIDVSLGKLLLLFVGEPLCNTGKFDDVQLVFYPFNAHAGFASKINIANFAVDAEYFAEEFARYRLETVGRSANLNLNDFLNFVADAVIDDPAAKSYGLYDERGAFFRTVYSRDGVVRNAEIVDEVPDHQSRMERLLKGVTPDGSFKMPQVDFYVECLPEKQAIEDGQAEGSTNGKSILRVHIFDRQASSYETLGALQASARNSDLEAIGQIPSLKGGNTGVQESQQQIAAETIEKALQLQLIEKIPNTDPTMYRVVGGPRQLKQFVMRTVPYIIYGAGGSTIKAANLSSMQNSQLSTINLLRSFRRNELTPNGENPGGLPMRIIPTELTIVSSGCPLVDFAQQFFVDFNTGTTADNIYAVSGITHRFSGGEFTTDMRFAPLDAWGKYQSLVDRVRNATEVLRDVENEQEED